eukprot:TRINITY_DN4518_c1_g1_i1.p1 TRINITY_DN4518_c1_g1~~TRINITY_DN4518_c1_g1_i1.p1  ORF type:complete len:575 (+),score=292.27 TRINITY_DN4518_c1_g1_i1:73-1797(+)
MREFCGRVDKEGQEVDILGDEKLIKTCKQVGSGDGTPPKGATVYVHYVGNLATGSKFDSSRDRDEPINFIIGTGQVIKGWEHGIASMRKGERSTLKIHHSLAYGEDGKAPVIPPAATLIFDVELLSWTSYTDISETKTKTLMKQTVVTPENEYTKPVYESELVVDIHQAEPIAADFEEEQQDNNGATVTATKLRTGVKVTIGEEDVPAALELALKSMVQGETSRFIVETNAPGLAPLPKWDTIGVEGEPEKLCVVVTLVSFVSPKQMYECQTPADKVKEGEKRKADGNTLYKAKKFKRAAAKYEAGLAFVEGDDAELKKVRLPLLTNLAAVQLEMQQNFFAAKNCEKALEIDPVNMRAILRKAKANRLRADFEAARADAEHALSLDANSKEAKAELEQVDKALKLQKQKDKKTYQGMFDKLAKKAPVQERTAAPKAAESSSAPDLEFKDSVEHTLHIQKCSLPEAVGEYRLNTKKLHRNSPFWERVSDRQDEAAWRIFSDPHSRWKFGLFTEMESGLGYVKSQDPHDMKVMPNEVSQWVHVAESGEWEPDADTVVSTTPAVAAAGPEVAEPTAA